MFRLISGHYRRLSQRCAKKPRKSDAILPPSSSPHQPNEDDPYAGGGEPRQPQRLRRNGQRPRCRALHTFREQSIEGSLDDQHKSKRRPQISHFPGRGAELPLLATEHESGSLRAHCCPRWRRLGRGAVQVFKISEEAAVRGEHKGGGMSVQRIAVSLH